MPRFARAVRPFGSRAFVSRLGAAFDVEIGKRISPEAAEVAMCVYRRNVRNARLSLFSSVPVFLFSSNTRKMGSTSFLIETEKFLLTAARDRASGENLHG